VGGAAARLSALIMAHVAVFGTFSRCVVAAAVIVASASAFAAGPPDVQPPRQEKARPQPPAARPAADPGIKGLERAAPRADGAIVVRERLSGNGVIRGGGHRIIEGTVAPGDSPGCVTDQGNVTFTGTGSLEIEIAGTTPCTGYDRLSVNLALTLEAATLRVLLLGGYTPAAGARFDVLDWGTLTGTFGTLDLPALPAGLTWNTASLYTTGELVVSSSGSPPGAQVPLPGWALLGLGVVLAYAGARWSGKRNG
jgi:hypothetical protein